MYLGKNDGIKWPYFFITGLASTEKSYIIYMIINLLKQRHSNYLLLAPTGVAAQNISGKTIHSELRIINTQRGFNTRTYTNNEFKSKLKNINTIIIEEISIVSAE